MSELCVISQNRVNLLSLRITINFLVSVFYVYFAYSTEYPVVSDGITVPSYYVRSLVITALGFILFFRLVNRLVENVVKMGTQRFNGEGHMCEWD
jgi:hypothetical protein